MVQKLTSQQRFSRLAEIWKKETLHISSSSQMAMHPAYQQIIGMGPAAIPFLLQELQHKPDHWSWALRAITGENPVKDEHQGKLALIAQDWIEWGKVRHMLCQSPEHKFRVLAKAWRNDCQWTSSINEMVSHYAYQEIIGMGPDAIPILLNEMQRDPDHWSWALRAITGENPVKEEHRGNIDLMAQEWVQWGKERGYLQ
jgi:hypothetical protein